MSFTHNTYKNYQLFFFLFLQCRLLRSFKQFLEYFLNCCKVNSKNFLLSFRHFLIYLLHFLVLLTLSPDVREPPFRLFLHRFFLQHFKPFFPRNSGGSENFNFSLASFRENVAPSSSFFVTLPQRIVPSLLIPKYHGGEVSFTCL